MLLEQYMDLSTSTIEDIEVIAVLYVIWLTLYLLARHIFFRSLSPDGANRVVSLLHAFIGIVLPAGAINFAALQADVGTPTTRAQLLALRVSLSYFLYDTFCCIAIELSTTGLDVATTFHHVATLSGLLVGVFQRVSGHELLCCLLLMEVSNPCMHTRFLLKETGMADTQLYAVNGAVFAFTFLMCRNVLGLPVVYWTVMSERTPLIVKAGGLGIMFVSLFWTKKLLSMIRRAFGSPEKGGKPGKLGKAA